jgi:hypothetical protein
VKYVLNIVLVFTAVNGWGAIVFDTSTAVGFGASPLSWSITIGNGAAGANQATVVDCGCDGNASVTAVTVNSVSCSIQQRFRSTNATISDATAWTCVGTANGANTVSATFSINNKCVCVANSYKGVNQTTTVDVSTGGIDTTGNAGPDSVSANTTVSNDMLDSGVILGNAIIAPGAGQTLTSRAFNSNEGTTTEGSFILVGASGSQTMSWANVFVINTIIWIALEPAAAAAGGGFNKASRMERYE